METDEDAYLNHIRFGAEAKLFSMVDVRAGINQGYLSLGVGLDLFVIHIDASYYWREYGAEIGDKPIDALTVRFNLVSTEDSTFQFTEYDLSFGEVFFS